MLKLVAGISYVIIAIAPAARALFLSAGRNDAAEAVDHVVSSSSAMADAVSVIVGAVAAMAGGVLHFLPSPLKRSGN